MKDTMTFTNALGRTEEVRASRLVGGREARKPMSRRALAERAKGRKEAIRKRRAERRAARLSREAAAERSVRSANRDRKPTLLWIARVEQGVRTIFRQEFHDGQRAARALASLCGADAEESARLASRAKAVIRCKTFVIAPQNIAPKAPDGAPYFKIVARVPVLRASLEARVVIPALQ
jgi:hypothetical protein